MKLLAFLAFALPLAAANLATDNGSTITVATGSATFTVKKANFNGFDVVDVGSTHVILTGASDGFDLYGPTPTASYPGNVTCSPTPGGTPCDPATGTTYKTKNDATSTCTIEENGPVMAILMCDALYNDGSAHTYQGLRIRMKFFVGQTYVREVLIPFKNADYGLTNTFATAWKGMQGIVQQLTANISGTLTYTIGNHTGTPTSGTLSGTDDAYLYQGLNVSGGVRQFTDNNQWIPYTTDAGYVIAKNGSNVQTGTNAQPAAGWCDISNSSGVGVLVGVYQMAPYGSKGCEFAGGGSDIRIGILDPHNSQPYYLEWPQHDERTELFLEFHATAPSSLNTDFQEFQAPLIAHQSVADYNTAAVFPYPLPTATQEDTAETTACSTANPNTIPGGNCWSAANVTQGADFGINNSNFYLMLVRAFSWPFEADYWQGNYYEHLMRGWPGHYLQAKFMYDWQSGYNLAWADGFTWASKGPAGGSLTDSTGQPSQTSKIDSANKTLGGSTVGPHQQWMTQVGENAHSNWYGMTDWYLLSGDEFINDYLKNVMVNFFSDTTTTQWGLSSTNTVSSNGAGTVLTLTCCVSSDAGWFGQWVIVGGVGSEQFTQIKNVSGTALTVFPAVTGSLGGSTPFNIQQGFGSSRGNGSQITAAARLATYMDATSQSSATVVQGAKNLWVQQVKSDLCVSGYPTSCSFGAVDNGTWKTTGTSTKRAVPWSTGGASGNWCAQLHTYRVNSGFQATIISEASYLLAKYAGSSWTDYWNAIDRSYGIARWAFNEDWVADGSGQWNTQGPRFGLALDGANNCNDGTLGSVYTVSTSGTALTGSGFNAGWSGAGVTLGNAPLTRGLVIINNDTAHPHYIVSCSSTSACTLDSSAGTLTSVPMYVQEVDYQYSSSNLNIPFLSYLLWFTEGAFNYSAQLKVMLGLDMAASGTANRDFQQYYVNSALYASANPGTSSLQSLTPMVTPSGTDYLVSYTVPANTTLIRAKWSPLTIVDWIGFDPTTDTFSGSPSTTDAWWATYDETPNAPAPSAGTQSFTVHTTDYVSGGVTGLTAANFSIKAFAPSGTPSVGGSVFGGSAKLGGSAGVH